MMGCGGEKVRWGWRGRWGADHEVPVSQDKEFGPEPVKRGEPTAIFMMGK